jgi:prevent-host-death family protein
VTHARAEFADMVNRVVYGGERVVVTRHGKPLVALVPAADLERLEQADRPDLDSEQLATVVRLGSDGGLNRPISTEPLAGRQLGIAAEHRPPGAPPR